MLKYVLVILRACACAMLTLSFTSAISAQVRVLLPATKFEALELIRATVQNGTTEPITYCIEFGQTSPTGASTEGTPFPFIIQRNVNGGWQNLLIGPDIGSILAPSVLDAGQSAAFPFRLNQNGSLRILLRYWPGSHPDLNCSKASLESFHIARPHW